ncbi:hypothetical protein [Streptomyces coelicoflavus]|uniref:hypothetical protein n=1 Tax=Streptomyces coelicoflavus TaxID=285562 RepID=UPI003AF31967
MSARMSPQGSRDTAPEIAVRRLLHASGLRYRVNVVVPGRAIPRWVRTPPPPRPLGPVWPRCC